ncbi:MAG: CoA transferase [Actinomycetota bacterium]
MTADAAPFPLDGVRVLDLSRAVAGPYAGRLLSDLGADVVKVELPGADVTQVFGARRNGHSGLYLQQNAGKRNVSVDLTSAGGAGLLTRLAAQADVVIENFRPGTLDRLGVGYAVLSAARPALILLSITGFGQWGPESMRRAYAHVVHAETGLIGRQAEADGEPPRDVVISLADSVTALHGTIAVLAALRMRDQTGTGQHIDLSMFEAMLATDDHVHYSLDGVPPKPTRGLIYPAPGGPVLVSGEPRYIWRTLRDGAGLRDPDPAAPADARIAARTQLVRGWFAGFTDRAQLIAELERLGLAWADVRDPATVLQSPTAVAREVAAQVDDRAGGTRAVIRTPYRFSAAASEPRGGAAYVGEHNAGVLAEWLDLNDQAVADLVTSGVLLEPGRPAGEPG